MTFSSNLRSAGWEIPVLLRITGDDAAVFLQGQFTNDLKGMKPGAAVYGLWLNQKGKVLADSFVIAGAEAGEFFVVSYFSGAAGLKRRLEDFIIADDVVVEDLTADWTGVAVFGVGAAAWLATKATVGFVFPGRRQREENVEWVFPRTEAAGVLEKLAELEQGDAAELNRRRIAAGIPAVPMDIGPGDLPGEGGLEAVAISYTKGCYLGQEVMARLKSMGQVRRRLMTVRGAGRRPTLPAALWQEGKQVGELRSAAEDAGGFVGLAMLSLVNFRPGAALGFAVDGPAEIDVIGANP